MLQGFGIELWKKNASCRLDRATADTLTFARCHQIHSVIEWINYLLLKRWTLVRFPIESNQRLKKLVFTNSLLNVQQLKEQCEATNACGRQVGTGQVPA